MALRLRKDFQMRNDGSYVVVYPRDTGELQSGPSDFGWRLLHPAEAVFVCLLDRACTLDEAMEDFAFLMDQPPEEARRTLLLYCVGQEEILEEMDTVPARPHRLDPHDFLIPSSRIDLAVPRLTRPTSCIWVVTLACPFRCRYCYADVDGRSGPQGPPMDLASAFRAIDAFREIDIGVVTISGGDPFLHPHILPILERLAGAGYLPEVPTKTPLHGEVLHALRGMGFHSLQYSLDSPTDSRVIEEHLGIDGSEYLARMRRSLLDAGRLGLHVAVNAVITRQNCDTVRQMIDYYGSLGFIHRLGLSHMGGSIYRLAEDLLPDAESMRRVDAAVDRGRDRYPWMRIHASWLPHPGAMTREQRDHWYRERARCSAGRSSFVLLPDGMMGLCEELYYHPRFLVGSTLERPILDLWNSERMLSILYPPQESIAHGPCRTCGDYAACIKGRGRCWRRALKAYRDRPSPHDWPDPFCPNAPPSPDWGI